MGYGGRSPGWHGTLSGTPFWPHGAVGGGAPVDWAYVGIENAAKKNKMSVFIWTLNWGCRRAIQLDKIANEAGEALLLE